MSLATDREPVEVWYWPLRDKDGKWVKVRRYIKHENGCLTASLPRGIEVVFGEEDWRKVNRESR